MSAEFKKIIVEGSAAMTSIEKDLAMLKGLEQMMGTGPIIGEAREVIIQLSRNIMVRDLLLDSMGMSVETREHIFKVINDGLDARDAKILAERKKQ